MNGREFPVEYYACAVRTLSRERELTGGGGWAELVGILITLGITADSH